MKEINPAIKIGLLYSAGLTTICEYAQSLQLGGIMIYDLLGGYDGKAPEGKKDLLLQTAKKLFLRKNSQ